MIEYESTTRMDREIALREVKKLLASLRSRGVAHFVGLVAGLCTLLGFIVGLTLLFNFYWENLGFVIGLITVAVVLLILANHATLPPELLVEFNEIKFMNKAALRGFVESTKEDRITVGNVETLLLEEEKFLVHGEQKVVAAKAVMDELRRQIKVGSDTKKGEGSGKTVEKITFMKEEASGH